MNIKEQYQIFTGNNAGFDFQQRDLTDQLNWNGLDKATAMPDLKAFQRLYRLYPYTDAAFAAFDSGYRSAHDIASRPGSAFIAQMAPVFETSLPEGMDGSRVAQLMWSGARSVSYQVNLAAAGLLPNRPNAAEAEHFSGLPKFHEGMPTWDTLFGPGHAAGASARPLANPAGLLYDLS